MRIIYNNKEVSNNARRYSTLINKPSINGVIIEGNVSLDTLDLYNKSAVEEKIENMQQMYIVSSLPADLEPSCMYYVGPDEENIYKVYIVDDTKHAIEIGTTQFGQYKGGPGVNVKTDNTINVNTDDNSILFDSEGKLKSSLDPDQLDAFTGATASTNGTRGLVPAPQIADRDKILLGNGTWGEANLIDSIYPVGALLVLYDNTQNPNTLFDGTTWTKLDSGYVIWMHPSETAGTKLDSKAPNITGKYLNRPGSYGNSGVLSRTYMNTSYNRDEFGALRIETISSRVGPMDNSGGLEIYSWIPALDFHRNNPIYGASDVVQPPAFKVCIWQRTA